MAPRAPRADARPAGCVAAATTGKDRRVFLSIAVISVGAAAGALLRWVLATQLNALFPALPPGTLMANLVGGYLIGVAIAVFAGNPALSPEWRLLTITGFLGGLTTFSTFSAEVVSQLMAGRIAWALSTILAHVLGSIAMTLLGIGTVTLLRPNSLSGS